jgi:predicted permease
MNGVLARARSFWRGLRRPHRLEAEMDEEMRFHVDMEAERLARERGLDPREARRQAAAAFGGTDRYKEEGRDARGLTRVAGASLDFRLGFRMVARHPGLTLIGVLAMAFGIAAGAVAFELAKDQLFPPLPYGETGRIVRVQNVSTRTTRPEPRALHDFAAWREELRSIDHLSALHLRERTLSTGAGAGAPVAEAAVSAAAFGLVRPVPLLGRPLLAADEAPGAPAVAVIGHRLWRERFAGDPDVVGRVVRLGGEATTVVGVMPEHFEFFLPQEGIGLPAPQDLWTPFRLDPLDHARGEGPAVAVFGRLARGATLEGARAELATLAATAAREWPDTHSQLKPEVLTFARPFAGGEGLVPAGVLSLSALFLGVLMVILCANVALLLFARAAAREGEMAVRSALGASRGRIVFQLFAEALVLAGLAILVGLAGASVALGWVIRVMRSMLQAQGVALPSWISDTLSPTTVGYAVVLAVGGAAVAGVLPGLKVTGRGPQASLQRLAGRGSGVRLGRVWTGIIVTQVALTVVFVPIAAMLGLQTAELRTVEHTLPAAAHLAVQLEAAGDEGLEVAEGAPGEGEALARFEQGYRALERRLADEPGVTGVTLAGQLPGSWHPRPQVEVEAPAGPVPPTGGSQAQVASVDPDFFEVMGAPIVAGRGFGAADAGAGRRVVVVNESFVREVMGGRNAVGQRLRFPGPAGGEGPGPWHEIVGVVEELAMTVDPTLPHNAGVYRPLSPGEVYPVRMAVRVAGDPAAFTGRLREIAADAAPGLRLHRALPLDQAARGMLIAHDAWFRVIVLAGAMALLLTNAGIYAVISFTVSRRTREIGVRVALGADPRRIVAAILARTARHVGAGVLAGGVLSVVVILGLSEGSWRTSLLGSGGLLAAYMAAMMGVCMLACVVPTRRALRIEPMEALNTDG